MGTKLKHIPGAAGLDEAGRGPLAGPVVAAAVILPKGFRVGGIDDSKKLSAARREELAVRIRMKCLHAVVAVSVARVDELNILWASMHAMELALAQLESEGIEIFVDGDRVPNDLKGRAKAVVGGDGRYACIAAASILAKTERDRLMRELAPSYPEYGFERHFGYATPEHLEALRRHGPCPIHRRSFEPIKSYQPDLFAIDA